MNRQRASLSLLAACAAAAAWSCTAAERDFRRALGAKDSQALQEFITKYPESPRLADVRSAIESLAFDDAVGVNAVSAYEAFLKRFPDGAHAPDAESRAERLDFEGAVRSASATGWDRFFVGIRRVHSGSKLLSSSNAQPWGNWRSWLPLPT